MENSSPLSCDMLIHWKTVLILCGMSSASFAVGQHKCTYSVCLLPDRETCGEVAHAINVCLQCGNACTMIFGNQAQLQSQDQLKV